jgi:hypothetical protein
MNTLLGMISPSPAASPEQSEQMKDFYRAFNKQLTDIFDRFTDLVPDNNNLISYKSSMNMALMVSDEIILNTLRTFFVDNDIVKMKEYITTKNSKIITDYDKMEYTMTTSSIKSVFESIHEIWKDKNMSPYKKQESTKLIWHFFVTLLCFIEGLIQCDT